MRSPIHEKHEASDDELSCSIVLTRSRQLLTRVAFLRVLMMLLGRPAKKEYQRNNQERFCDKKKYDPGHVYIDAGWT